MAQQVELRRLRLRGSGAIVLTASSVCHQNKNAFFGSRSTTIPLHSITGLYVGWERSRIVLFFCGLGFAGWIGTIALGNIPVPVLGNIPAPVQYVLLLLGIVMFVTFFFVKGRKVEILSPTTIIKGTPVSFEDAEGFCTFLSEILRTDYKVKFNGS